MDKLIVSDRGEAQITNDGATILKLLDIVHPAAKTLVDIARAQDAEVGDGTTSVVLLAPQFLKEIRQYIEEGMRIIKGYRMAADMVRRCVARMGRSLGANVVMHLFSVTMCFVRARIQSGVVGFSAGGEVRS